MDDVDMLHVTRFRCVPVSRDSFRTAPRHRLLPHSGLRPVDPHRHLVVGFVLDQRRRESGARLSRPADRVTATTVSDQCDGLTTGRPADRVDDDDDERWSPGVSTARLLHQGDRRLDDRLPRVRLLVFDRVRRRQRPGAADSQVHRLRRRR